MTSGFFEPQWWSPEASSFQFFFSVTIFGNCFSCNSQLGWKPEEIRNTFPTTRFHFYTSLLLFTLSQERFLHSWTAFCQLVCALMTFLVSSVPQCVAVDATVDHLSSGSVEETITSLSLLTACWRPAILTEEKVNIQAGVSVNSKLYLQAVAEISSGVHE